MSAFVEIDQQQIAALGRDFRLMADEVPVAVSRAINRTLTAINTEASVQVRKHYALKATRVKKNFKVYKSTKNNLSGRWFSKGRPVGLLQFGSQQRPQGVSVKVLTSGSRKIVYGSFIQIPRRTRTGKAIRSGPQVFWRAKVGGVRVDRYDIHRLEGPRIEDALAKNEVQIALKKKNDETLQARLEAEANYILLKAKT